MPARARRTGLALLALAAACVPVAPAAGAPRAVFTRLSNLHTTTRWAYPSEAAVIRLAPSPRSRALGRLRFLTIDEQAYLYIVLASERVGHGREWLQLEVPGRPNGERGWVPRAALGELHTLNGYLHVDEASLTATLFHDGRAVFTAPVGVGKASTVTPTGHFYVLEKLRALNAPLYGPFAIGTSAYAPTLSEWPGGGVVGIHGTDEPQLIPGRPSHGCIRMRNEDITRLWPLIEVGTPIEIT